MMMRGRVMPLVRVAQLVWMTPVICAATGSRPPAIIAPPQGSWGGTGAPWRQIVLGASTARHERSEAPSYRGPDEVRLREAE